MMSLPSKEAIEWQLARMDELATRGDAITILVATEKGWPTPIPGKYRKIDASVYCERERRWLYVGSTNAFRLCREARAYFAHFQPEGAAVRAYFSKRR